MFETGSIIFCQRVEKGLNNLEFDMSLVYQAEARLSEIAIVTPMTAPELLALFNEAYLKIGRFYSQLEYELDKAHNTARKRRAIVLLDEAPGYVQTHNLGSARSPIGSEDIRTAIIDKDQEYNDILDRISGIKATKTLMYMKLQSMEMSYNSVKKIMGDRNFNITPALNGNISVETQVGTTEETPKSGWGKPKYDFRK